MELQSDNSYDLRPFARLLTNDNITLVLAFLDRDTINNIIIAGANQHAQQCRFVSIANIKFFIMDYLNKTDRSIYMPFYSEPFFINIQHEQLSYITTNNTQGLRLLSDSCKALFSRLKNEINDFQMGQQVVDSLVQSLTDPQLPFPKLRKHDIGMHCNSAFQFFLVDQLSSSSEQEDLEETFYELNKFVSGRWNLSGSNEKRQLDIIQEVFSSWFKITYQNFQHYLLPGSTHHNIVVIVVALLDLFVDSFSFYIQAIQDPLYSFIEFNMRFCIFRNIVLSLEGKLGQLFKNYSLFCREILEKKKEIEIESVGVESEQIREMTIWHCGLSKWYIYMQHMHQIYFKTYFYLLKKTNLKNIREQNSQRMQESSAFIQLQNRLEVNEMELLEREKTFEVYSPFEDIFDQNPELYNQALKEYIQYIVDISINEYSVHWCGHSEHVMHIPYQQFDRMVIESYQHYINKMERIAVSVCDPAVAIGSMLKSMIEQLDKQYIKPVTLKKVIQYSKCKAIGITGQAEYQQSQLAETLKSIDQSIISRDKVLEHFNGNAGISNEISYKYSIVLENEDFTKLLKTSASTNASSLSQSHHLKMYSIMSSDSIMEEDFL